MVREGRNGRAARLLPARLLGAQLLVVLLTGWLLWPQRRSGYGLGHDMVFTPHQPLNAGSIGLGSTPPRAVPLDGLVATAGRLLGGQLTGRLALAVPLLLAGWGMVRLLRDCGGRRLPGLLLGAGCAVWNPFVVERLALGQWALLWCYGALPWLVAGANRFRTATPPRDGRSGRWLAARLAGPVLALACCAITPTGALIGAVTLLVVGWGRCWGALLGVAALVQLPWLLPALTGPASATSDPAGVAAFAARAEHPGGALVSLLGLGGSWNADVMPPSRAGALGWLTAVAVLLALAAGFRFVRPLTLAVRLVWLAGAGLLVAAAASLPGTAAGVRWLVRTVPGGGLLRDGQKWLIPFVLVAVLTGALAVDRLAGRVQSDRLAERFEPARWLLAVAALALPLLLLPDGPATLRTPLTPVRYPAGWTPVAARLAGSPDKVLVLPFASYRSFDWAPGQTVLDPAPRLLAAPTVVDDRLAVGGRVLAGEDPAAAAAARLLASRPAPAALAAGLAAQGIGWVVVEQGTPGPPLPDLSGLTPAAAGPGVSLYRVPGRIRRESADPARTILVLTGDLLAALLVGAALAQKAGQAGHRLLHSPVTHRT